MWQLKNIPKIMHIYFGGEKMSYLRFQTIRTFFNLNPDWTVIFYYPKFPTKRQSWASFEQKYQFDGDDYLQKALELPIQKMQIDFASIGVDNNISEVHKSDYLRWHLLSTEGGLWSDMDILYFRPMDDLPFNTSGNSNIDTVVCIGSYGHSIGFMMGSKDNQYYKVVRDNAKRVWNSSSYQSIGAVLSNNLFPNMDVVKKMFPRLSVINLPMEVVYAYDAIHVGEIYNSSDTSKFTPHSIGLHWYAGHPMAGAFLQKTFGGAKNTRDCLVGKVLSAVTSKGCIDYINDRLTPESTVLDAGCGDKYVISKLAGKHTTLDVWEKFNPDVVWNLNNTPLPFEDESFDTILLLDTIEHIDRANGFKLLEDLKRIAKKEVILLTPMWWTENVTYMSNPDSPYYQNPYERHKSLWRREDFRGWREITEIDFIKDYYFGMWEKNEPQNVPVGDKQL